MLRTLYRINDPDFLASRAGLFAGEEVLTYGPVSLVYMNPAKAQFYLDSRALIPVKSGPVYWGLEGHSLTVGASLTLGQIDATAFCLGLASEGTLTADGFVTWIKPTPDMKVYGRFSVDAMILVGVVDRDGTAVAQRDGNAVSLREGVVI